MNDRERKAHREHWEKFFGKDHGLTIGEPVGDPIIVAPAHFPMTDRTTVYLPIIHPRIKCAYCGMDDFAHNQCQRCGARQA